MSTLGRDTKQSNLLEPKTRRTRQAYTSSKHAFPRPINMVHGTHDRISVTRVRRRSSLHGGVPREEGRHPGYLPVTFALFVEGFKIVWKTLTKALKILGKSLCALLFLVVVLLVVFTLGYTTIGTLRIRQAYLAYLATLPELHPLADAFPKQCPPLYRFYPNYERVLGMPAPLYPHLHPPFSVVDRYYKRLQKCWHPDKRGRYRFLSDQQFEEIRDIIGHSYKKLTVGREISVYPRFLGKGSNIGVLEDSIMWKTELKPKTVALYSRNCSAPTLSSVPRLLRQTRPKSEAELRDYCPWSFDVVLQTYQWFLENNLPPPGHDWYIISKDLAPLSSLFDAYVYAFGTNFFDPRAEGVHGFPIEEKRRLLKEKWFFKTEFWRDMALMEELDKERDEKIKEEVSAWFRPR